MYKAIKDMIAALVYLPHKYGIIKNPIRVYSIDETLDELIRSKKSLVRFGDGEIVMIKGESLQLQEVSPELINGLKRILSYEHDNLMVSVQGVFDGVERYQKKSRQFWKDHLLFCRRIYLRCCNRNRIYGNTEVTRCYYVFSDKSKSGKWFEKFKKVWENKEIVVVEGTKTHNGVGNDLFDNAAGVERIICPPKNAFAVYDRILEKCCSFSKDKLFLISLGVTAKFLAEDLYLRGYRVIDIGNLDMEYEWFLMGTIEKAVIGKHSITGRDANLKAGYIGYLEQIREIVEIEG